MKRKNYQRRFYDAPTDGGGSLSPEDIAAMTKGIEEMSNEVKDTKAKMAELEQKNADLGIQLDQSQKDLIAFKELMTAKHGKSGAMDFANEFGKHLSGQFHAVHPKGIENRNSEYAESFRKDYDTMTDATAAYLVDDELAAGILELSDTYGKIIDRIDNYTVAPGKTLKINRENALPVASWRTTAANTTSAEGETIPAMTGGTFAQVSKEPVLVGCRFTASNEMLNVPGIGFGAMMARKAARAITRKEEYSIIRGTHGGSANDPPSNGLLIDSAVNDLTDIPVGGLTASKLLTFISNAIAAYGPLEDTMDNVIMIPTAQYLNLAGETVNASNAAFIWANPREQIPTSVFGYELIHHVDMTDGTNQYAAIGSLEGIARLNSGTVEIGFNPWGTGWDTNETSVRVITHSNYVVQHPAVWQRAAFALT